MLSTLWGNLSKEQKLGVVVVSQLLLIGIIALVLHSFLAEPSHVEIAEGGDTAESANVPENVKDFVEDNIWQVIKLNVPGVDTNNVDDVVVREGSYEEEENDDGSISMNFIVDIDSLKQTYTVSTGVSKDKKTVYEVVVDCPPLSEMKYKETVCHGMYHNTYSLDLYVPYAVYPDGFDSDDAQQPLAPNYMITGDEDNHTLNIMVSVCDEERFKNEALEYLKTTPINLDEYTINYEINSVNVECAQ